MAPKLVSRPSYNKNAYDTEMREVSVTLPSGRVLYFSEMWVDEYDSDAVTEKRVEEYKAELASMLAELGAKVEF